jgi:hypothetical protein
LESISAVMDAHLRYFKQVWSPFYVLSNFWSFGCLGSDLILYDIGI